jgi:hypothetical protein
MQHGDLRVGLSLGGEPRKLLVYWRGWLREIVPESASVTILRPYRPHPDERFWYYTSPHIQLEMLTRTEKKRAELSISDKALMMQPEEIGTARELTDKTFDWLSRRTGIPDFDRPTPGARLNLRCVGDETLLEAVEKFNDPEVLEGEETGAVFLQGAPRRPEVRWLPAMHNADTTHTLAETRFFERSLAQGQAERLRQLVTSVARMFRKRREARRAAVNKRYFQIFGLGSEVSFRDEPITDEMLDGYRYEELLAWLDVKEQELVKKRSGSRTTR